MKEEKITSCDVISIAKIIAEYANNDWDLFNYGFYVIKDGRNETKNTFSS